MVAFLIFISITAIVIRIAVFGRKSEIEKSLERNEARRQWGKHNDFEMSDRPNPEPPLFVHCITGVSDNRIEPLKVIKLFSMGGIAHNLQEGTFEGREVKVFDYRQVVANGKYSYLVEYSIVGVKLRAGVPKFELRPHKFWDHVAALFGYRDFVIHSPEFDHRFYISSGDDDYVVGLLDHTVQDRLLAHDDDSWHCVNGFLVLVGLGYRSEAELDRMLRDAIWFASRVDR